VAQMFSREASPTSRLGDRDQRGNFLIFYRQHSYSIDQMDFKEVWLTHHLFLKSRFTQRLLVQAWLPNRYLHLCRKRDFEGLFEAASYAECHLL
jgi:hypothetical protein